MREAPLVVAAMLHLGCVTGRPATPTESVEPAPATVEFDEIPSADSPSERPTSAAPPQPGAPSHDGVPSPGDEAQRESLGPATVAASAPLVAWRWRAPQRSKLCVGKAPPPQPPPKGCCYVPGSTWERLLEPAKKRAAECQARAIERGEAQEGRLAVTLEADAQGNVARACDSTEDDISEPTFVRCVLEGFRELELPEAGDFCPAVRMTYPLVF